MIWLATLGLIVLLCFGVVLLFGAPYLPTLKPQIKVALELSNLEPNSRLLELGSGDGRLLIAAAKQGIFVIGYELNPVLFALSWLRIRPYRSHASVRFGNFWTANWPPADAIFVFLLPRYMSKLDKRIITSATKPVRLISFAFEVKGKPIARQKQGVLVYEYKAK